MAYAVKIYTENPDPLKCSAPEIQRHVRENDLPIAPIKVGGVESGDGIDCMYRGIVERDFADQLVACINELEGVEARITEE
jgi:hypothetical protein